MNPHQQTLEFERRKIERQLESGIQQPSCGCHVEWQWIYDNTGFLPASVVLIEIRPCRKRECLGMKVDELAHSINFELRHRLCVLRERP